MLDAIYASGKVKAIASTFSKSVHAMAYLHSVKPNWFAQAETDEMANLI